MENTASHDFKRANASLAFAEDGTEIEYMNPYSVEYRFSGKSLLLRLETVVRRDGVPDGAIVYLDEADRWQDGSTITEAELRKMADDFAGASECMSYKFRLHR